MKIVYLKQDLNFTAFCPIFRLEMYCRDLTKSFEDVWVVSGPLVLPEVGDDGKKAMSYQVMQIQIKFKYFLFNR